jgi:HSP20 family molecular chaperone IbpA
MRFNEFHISKELLKNVDLMNTINGGISKPTVIMEREEKNYMVTARIPGVGPEKLRIEVKNNRLFLFHDIDIENPALYSGKKVIPFNIGYIIIPFDVNIKGIEAIYADKELKITMPFNELSDGYYKRIDINN